MRKEQEIAKIARLADAVMAVVRRTGRWLRYEQSTLGVEQQEEKSPGDLVSRVDREADQRLRGDLLNLMPDAGLLSEEGSEHKGKGRYRWIVDPLDGSNNYLAGLPTWAVSVALEEVDRSGGWGDLLIGIIYLPKLDQMYTARLGFGAKLNDHDIHVVDRPLNRSALSHWWPAQGEDQAPMQAVVKKMLGEVPTLRTLGSPAAELAMLADGTLQGFFATGMEPWDLAAGLLILEEAGGVITDPWNRNPLDSGSVVAGTEPMVKLLRETMSQHFER